MVRLLVALGIGIYGLMPEVAGSAILSLDMLRDRSTQALVEFYRTQRSAINVTCRSARLEGSQVRFAIVCGGAGSTYVWLAQTTNGETIALSPLNDLAVQSAPPVGSSVPPKGDPRHVQVVQRSSEERALALTEIKRTMNIR